MTDQASRISTAIQFVRLGYGDIIDGASFRSLNFLTDVLLTVEAQAVLEAIPEYNSFDGSKAARAIARFRKRVSGWSIGRAGSPLIQIELPAWTHQAEEAPPEKGGVRIGESEQKQLIAELKNVFVDELRADIFESSAQSERAIQVWWD